MMLGRGLVATTVSKGEPFEVRVLVQHPMETGYRRDLNGQAIPMNVVDKLVCRIGGREVFRAELGSGMAANPYIAFFVGVQEGGTAKSVERRSGEPARFVAGLGVARRPPCCCCGRSCRPRNPSRRGAGSSSRASPSSAPGRQSAILGDGVTRGEALWKERCVSCHQDATVSMRGVAVRYPRHDAGLGRVVNLDERIRACAERGAGAPIAFESEPLLALSAYVSRQSRGLPLSVAADGPAAPVLARGRELYFERQGQLNLACTQCHDGSWGRTLLAEKVSQGHPADWPAYRWRAGLGSLRPPARPVLRPARELPPFSARPGRPDSTSPTRPRVATHTPGVRNKWGQTLFRPGGRSTAKPLRRSRNGSDPKN